MISVFTRVENIVWKGGKCWMCSGPGVQVWPWTLCLRSETSSWLIVKIGFLEYYSAPPRWLSVERVRLMISWLWVRSWLRQLFFLAYILLSPLPKYVRKVVGGFGKKSCVSTGVRAPGNTCASPTGMIWP